jgi:hypothetical protein
MIFTSGIAAFIIVSLASFYFRRKYRWKAKKNLDAASGQSYLHYTKTYKGNVNRECIGIEIATKISFLIGPENNTEKLLKKLGISNEFQTKDVEFDKEFYIACDNDVFQKELEYNSELRKIITEIFASHSPKFIMCAGGKLWAEYGRESFQGNELISKLEQIKRIILGINTSFFRTISNKTFIKAFLLMGFHTGALITGGLLLFFVISGYKIIDLSEFVTYSIIAGLIAACLWFFIIILVMNKSSKINLVLTDFVISGIAGIALLSSAILFDLNYELDKSPLLLEQSYIFDKYSYRCGKKNRSTCYTIVFSDIDDKSKAMKYKSSHDEYMRAQVGSYAILNIRNGYFKIRFIEEIVF